ncbi:MAG: hypothetical protein ACOYB3_04980 [Azonexus sp.]
MEQLIELLKQIQELAGVAIEALQGAGQGGKEGGPPPAEGGGEGGPPKEGPPPEGPPPGR